MAPLYRCASAAQKKKVLDVFACATGYHRKYAMWLLNHTQEGQSSPACPCPSHYGLDVQEALVLVWKHWNCICAKRLIPFLPTWMNTLEQHGHLHLSQTCRERLLRAQRYLVPYSLSTTRAGTLLK